MSKAADVLISVHHCHAKNFKSGKKTVELRRRAVRLMPGTRVWIYTKLPYGSVELLGTVEEVVQAPPRTLWRRYGKDTGITKREFTNYFRDTDLGSAIRFRRITKLSPSIQLKNMRRISSAFQPPQFLKFLRQNSPELSLLLTSKRSSIR